MTEISADSLADSVEPARARRREWRRWLSHRSIVIGGGGLAMIIVLALLAPVVTSHDPYAQDLLSRRIPPIWHLYWGSDKATWVHPLGTDNLGRDYWARLVYGARISLLIGITTALLAALIGTVLGVAAGYFGGRTDLVVSFLVTTRLAMPVILIALAVVAKQGGSLWSVILVAGLLLWDRFAVVMRSATQATRSQDYVMAAEAIGCSHLRIILTEILPNVASAFIVILTIEMAAAILLEAALSFLGMGVQSPLPSWGLMLAEAKPEIFFSSWMIMIPGAALFTLVMCINLVGDGIRDVTSPEAVR